MGLTARSSGRAALGKGGGPFKNEAGLPVVALAGNPNVGKSTVFNALTGLKQHTGNWTGKTVTLASGRLKGRDILLVDLPGCYSLVPNSREERVARDFLADQSPSAVIAVVDAACLERSLSLALQILALTGRLVLLVNLMDEARKRGISIDCALLSERLGVPVLPCSARNGEGLDALIEAIPNTNGPANGREEYRAFLSDGGPGAAEAAAACLKECSRLLEGVVTRSGQEGRSRRKADLTARIDRIVTGRFTAFPLMLLLLLGVFYLSIVGANYPSELLSKLFSSLEALLYRLFARLNVAGWLTDALLAGMFRTVGWVVAVMLPPMAIFFPLFTLLEDLGFLPRAAFNLDRCFRCCGACGKQALTISMGFGCNAAGVVGCRIIPDEKERLAAMLTNSFVPCNGRFPLLVSLAALFLSGGAAGNASPGNGAGGSFGGGSSWIAALELALFVVLAVAVTLGVTYLLSKTLLRGERSSFLLELPPYRPPQVGRVIVRSVLDRTLHVLGRAAAVAAPAGLIIYALANISLGGGSLLSAFCAFLDPFARCFGLDGTILAAFILGFPANEIVLPIILLCYTSGGSLAELGSYSELWSILSSHGWTWTTALSVILFSLFHWPCSTTLLTIRKEAGGTKWMLLAMALPTAVGLLLLLLLNGAIRLIGLL